MHVSFGKVSGPTKWQLVLAVSDFCCWKLLKLQVPRALLRWSGFRGSQIMQHPFSEGPLLTARTGMLNVQWGLMPSCHANSKHEICARSAARMQIHSTHAIEITKHIKTWHPFRKLLFTTPYNRKIWRWFKFSRRRPVGNIAITSRISSTEPSKMELWPLNWRPKPHFGFGLKVVPNWVIVLDLQIKMPSQRIVKVQLSTSFQEIPFRFENFEVHGFDVMEVGFPWSLVPTRTLFVEILLWFNWENSLQAPELQPVFDWLCTWPCLSSEEAAELWTKLRNWRRCIHALIYGNMI